jgi:ribosomal subunit interface protein
LAKLKKYTSLGLSNVNVNLDLDKSRKGSGEDAVVELVSDMRQKKVAVRETDKTFFKAFFTAVSKLERIVSKEKEQRSERPRRK